MDGHRDGVSCMAKNPNYLKGLFSGSMDGGNSFCYSVVCIVAKFYMLLPKCIILLNKQTKKFSLAWSF